MGLHGFPGYYMIVPELDFLQEASFLQQDLFQDKSLEWTVK